MVHSCRTMSGQKSRAENLSLITQVPPTASAMPGAITPPLV